MMVGMSRHWKAKGMIPMTAVQRLSQQMWQALSFLHSRNCAHRDVKADNFLMDLPEVESPENRIFLGDFGEVVELTPGTRLSKKCGSREYWSPEFYRKDYALKVDCWAAGVVMYGLCYGSFPFNNETEVMQK